MVGIRIINRLVRGSAKQILELHPREDFQVLQESLHRIEHLEERSNLLWIASFLKDEPVICVSVLPAIYNTSGNGRTFAGFEGFLGIESKCEKIAVARII